MVQFLEKVKDKFPKIYDNNYLISKPPSRQVVIFFVFSLRTSVRNYFSANTGTNTAHNQISLISALCHLKRLFDMDELNAIHHFYI